MKPMEWKAKIVDAVPPRTRVAGPSKYAFIMDHLNKRDGKILEVEFKDKRAALLSCMFAARMNQQHLPIPKARFARRGTKVYFWTKGEPK